MARKCLNHPDSFCYVCEERFFRFQRRHFTARIKKYLMNIILGVKWVTKIKVGPLIFVA